MIIFKTASVDPYFNLASEEYLIKNCPDDVFMLWRNSPAVIIGRAQNAYAEINRPFVEEHGIKVVRRLSGGGAVFHDLGNVNFTFIVKDTGGEVDFSTYTAPIIRALKTLGIDAELSGRNDIVCGGSKISGNAQCRMNGRLLHHGTLLFGADLTSMSGALNVNLAKLRSKGIKSVRSRVANIKDLCPPELYTEHFKQKCVSELDTERFNQQCRPEFDTVSFKEYLEKFAAAEFDCPLRPFSEEEKAAISRLSEEKYSRWEWNWGESRRCENSNEAYFPYGLVSVDYTLGNGVIVDVRISGDFFGKKEIDALAKKLIGVRAERGAIEEASSDIDDYISGATPSEFAQLFIQ